MKHFVLILTAPFTLQTGFAQNNSIGKSDPAAKALLDAVSAKFKSFKAVQAVFNLKAEDGKGKVQGNKKGTVFMKGVVS